MPTKTTLSTPSLLTTDNPNTTPHTDQTHHNTPSTPPLSKKSSQRILRLQTAVPPKIQPMGTYVGELQAKWQWPSDHLPIGITLGDTNIASWNVLDSAHMRWITEENSQGLSHSLIAEEHVFVPNSRVTMRDLHVIHLLLEMLSHPTHPRSIISLQECSAPFLQELSSKLPPSFEMISMGANALLLDTRRFRVEQAIATPGIFSDAPRRTVQDVLICSQTDPSQKMRLINAQLPGAPTSPSRFEFAAYLHSTFDPTTVTLVMGDMNFTEVDMRQALQQNCSEKSPFSVHTPYPTNIEPYSLRSKAIDPFLFYSPDPLLLRLNTPNEIVRGLAPIVDLIR